VLPPVRRFVRSSLVWLAAGLALGVAMAFAPARAPLLRLAHVHALLAGFVSLMIFGVAYHALPRFAGRPLHHPGAAAIHLWLANAGVTLLVGGWLALAWGLGFAELSLRAGASAFALGALAFIWNLWITTEPEP
jgi:heme/copper-type cytochrome/quinol oxidase subunit 1